jgi:glycerate kinase
LNDPTEASFGVAETAEGRLAIVEMAAASGLALLAPSRRDPRITTTRGTGDLIAASLDRSPDQLVVALGQRHGRRRMDGAGAGACWMVRRDINPGSRCSSSSGST